MNILNLQVIIMMLGMVIISTITYFSHPNCGYEGDRAEKDNTVVFITVLILTFTLIMFYLKEIGIISAGAY